MIATCCLMLEAVHALTGSERPTPPRPSCKQISGTDTVAFTTDGGKSFVTGRSGLQPHTYTRQFAMLTGVPAMLVIEKEQILVSRDAGCTWTPFSVAGKIPFPEKDIQIRDLTFRAAGETTAIASTPDSQLLVTVDSTHVKSVSKVPVTFADAWMSPDSHHLMVVGDWQGELSESLDGGATWKKIGKPPVSPMPVGVAASAFGPGARRIAISYMVGGGLWVSPDHGRTWKLWKPSALSERRTVEQIVISPVDDRWIWVATSEPALYESSDGGVSFTKVKTQAPSDLSGAVGDPRQASVIHLSGGQAVYRLDGSDGSLSRRHVAPPNTQLSFVSAIAFSPAYPALMYVRFSAGGVIYQSPRNGRRPVSNVRSEESPR